MKKKVQHGYIVRNEKVLTGENYKNGLVEIKAEGDKVSKDDNVFRYYSNNEKNLAEKIAELDVEIQEALEGQTDVYSADIQLLDKQIEENLQKILATNNVDEIEEYKGTISEALIKKAKIAGELSPSGSYINKLIEERRGYEEKLNSGQEYIKADRSGVMSYRIDGLEEFLTPSNFDNIDEELLDSYNIKTGQLISTSKEAGKIVDNYECYIIVFLESNEAREANVGDTLTLRISETSEINAEITYKREEDTGKVMLVFKINKAVEELIAYRKISIDVIWWSYSGLKVPNTALKKEGELYYLTRNRTGYKDKIFVKILKQNNDYAIIENYGTEELLEFGYTRDEISSMKSIGLYDEVLVNNEN